MQTAYNIKRGANPGSAYMIYRFLFVIFDKLGLLWQYNNANMTN